MGVHFILCLPIPLPTPSIPSAGRQVIIGRWGSSLGPDPRRQCLAAPWSAVEDIGFSTHGFGCRSGCSRTIRKNSFCVTPSTVWMGRGLRVVTPFRVTTTGLAPSMIVPAFWGGE